MLKVGALRSPARALIAVGVLARGSQGLPDVCGALGAASVAGFRHVAVGIRGGSAHDAGGGHLAARAAAVRRGALGPGGELTRRALAAGVLPGAIRRAAVALLAGFEDPVAALCRHARVETRVVVVEDDVLELGLGAIGPVALAARAHRAHDVAALRAGSRDGIGRHAVVVEAHLVANLVRDDHGGSRRAPNRVHLRYGALRVGVAASLDAADREAITIAELVARVFDRRAVELVAAVLPLAADGAQRGQTNRVPLEVVAAEEVRVVVAGQRREVGTVPSLELAEQGIRVAFAVGFRGDRVRIAGAPVHLRDEDNLHVHGADRVVVSGDLVHDGDAVRVHGVKLRGGDRAVGRGERVTSGLIVDDNQLEVSIRERRRERAPPRTPTAAAAAAAAVVEGHPVADAAAVDVHPVEGHPVVDSGPRSSARLLAVAGRPTSDVRLHRVQLHRRHPRSRRVTRRSARRVLPNVRVPVRHHRRGLRVLRTHRVPGDVPVRGFEVDHDVVGDDPRGDAVAEGRADSRVRRDERLVEGAAVQRGVSDVRADGHGEARDAAVVAVIATDRAARVVVVVVVRGGNHARGVDVP